MEMLRNQLRFHRIHVYNVFLTFRSFYHISLCFSFLTNLGVVLVTTAIITWYCWFRVRELACQTRIRELNMQIKVFSFVLYSILLFYIIIYVFVSVFRIVIVESGPRTRSSCLRLISLWKKDSILGSTR